MTTAKSTGLGEVVLKVPARPAFLHVVRAVVSGVAARRGLFYDAIDDLCLAANEAAAHLLGVQDGGGHGLCVRMRVEDDIELTFLTDGPVERWPPALSQSLAWRILKSLVDDVAFLEEEGCPAIRLVMSGPARYRD
jgi:hypothetical protein